LARYPVNPAPALAEFLETPLARGLATLTRRWSVLALQALDCGPARFNELQRCLTGITHKVLIDTLRSLQRDGFVSGPLTGGGSEYRLTPVGADLVGLIAEFQKWCENQLGVSSVITMTGDIDGVRVNPPA
jgi:DNA-binding HxlR family transcriptional regulator